MKKIFRALRPRERRFYNTSRGQTRPTEIQRGESSSGGQESNRRRCRQRWRLVGRTAPESPAQRVPPGSEGPIPPEIRRVACCGTEPAMLRHTPPAGTHRPYLAFPLPWGRRTESVGIFGRNFFKSDPQSQSGKSLVGRIGWDFGTGSGIGEGAANAHFRNDRHVIDAVVVPRRRSCCGLVGVVRRVAGLCGLKMLLPRAPLRCSGRILRPLLQNALPQHGGLHDHRVDGGASRHTPR